MSDDDVRKWLLEQELHFIRILCCFIRLQALSYLNIYRITYHFLAGSNDTHLAKAYVPRWRGICAIALSNYHDINRTSQCCRVDFIIETFHIWEQFADDVHGGDGLFPAEVYYNEILTFTVPITEVHCQSYSAVELATKLVPATFNITNSGTPT